MQEDRLVEVKLLLGRETGLLFEQKRGVLCCIEAILNVSEDGSGECVIAMESNLVLLPCFNVELDIGILFATLFNLQFLTMVNRSPPIGILRVNCDHIKHLIATKHVILRIRVSCYT